MPFPPRRSSPNRFRPSNRPAFHGTQGKGNFAPHGVAAANPARVLSPIAQSRNRDVKHWPNVGEIVVVRVDKVLDYGVFCSLLEYESATGFVHISQVESSWIKNIRNYVNEGQMRAALVQKVDREKLQIDLSLTKVNERTQRLRLEEFNQLNRNKKLIEQMAKSKNKSFEEGWKVIAEPLIRAYGTLPQAFEAISLEGETAVENVSKEWAPILVEVVQKNIRPIEREVKGTLSIASRDPNGIELIKNAFAESKKGVQNASVNYFYLGAGKYLVKVVSFDYKLAEKALVHVQEKINKGLGSNAQISFARQEA